MNSGTSILAGFAIFSALGYMATEMGVEVKDVARGGNSINIIKFTICQLCNIFCYTDSDNLNACLWESKFTYLKPGNVSFDSFVIFFTQDLD